jgi:hypothetical protein
VELKPVYLLAPLPEPPPPSRFSRRALLGWGTLALTTGLSLGAVARELCTPQMTKEEDARLRWLKETLGASDAELFERRHPVFQVLAMYPATLRESEAGLMRLVRMTETERLAREDRRTLARELVTLLERFGDRCPPLLRDAMTGLRATGR